MEQWENLLSISLPLQNTKKDPIMNENVKKVLKRVASGVWHKHSNGIGGNKYQCEFCCVAPHSEHHETCPTTLARQELEKENA
jgi:hypothetical protein